MARSYQKTVIPALSPQGPAGQLHSGLSLSPEKTLDTCPQISQPPGHVPRAQAPRRCPQEWVRRDLWTNLAMETLWIGQEPTGGSEQTSLRRSIVAEAIGWRGSAQVERAAQGRMDVEGPGKLEPVQGGGQPGREGWSLRSRHSPGAWGCRRRPETGQCRCGVNQTHPPVWGLWGLGGSSDQTGACGGVVVGPRAPRVFEFRGGTEPKQW